ncbi:hypothetical protein [Pontitalea aquivivens]|uniref:hypothetical protein n=1 Tax=Pontitalea aquivivens TaxID=3388663 RepID=UPI0039709EC3
MNTFRIKQGDTSPALGFALEPAAEVNLTGASVVFNMRPRRGDPTILRAPAIVVLATGTPTVRYDWASGDTGQSGTYEAEFEVTYADGAIETFPNAGYIRVEIADDIA